MNERASAGSKNSWRRKTGQFEVERSWISKGNFGSGSYGSALHEIGSDGLSPSPDKKEAGAD